MWSKSFVMRPGAWEHNSLHPPPNEVPLHPSPTRCPHDYLSDSSNVSPIRTVSGNHDPQLDVAPLRTRCILSRNSLPSPPCCTAQTVTTSPPASSNEFPSHTQNDIHLNNTNTYLLFCFSTIRLIVLTGLQYLLHTSTKASIRSTLRLMPSR